MNVCLTYDIGVSVTQEDPNRTVQAFIDLIQRHEQSFYSFVHKVHSKGEGLFDSLMRWIELFLTFVREGLGQPISLEFLLPHKGSERAEILAEVDKVALYHYKLKLLYEDKIRRRFGRTQAQGDADAEDQATKALVDGVVGEISFGDLIDGDAVDLAAEDADEESAEEEEDDDDDGEDESSSEYETGSSELESDSEESEDVAPPPPPPKSSTADLRRSRTTTQVSLNTRSGSRPPSVPRSRPDVFALKTSRSMSAMNHKVQRSYDMASLPPVPALPRNPHLIALSKPLPPSPSSRSPMEHFEQQQQLYRPSIDSTSHPVKPKKRRTKGKQVLKPPELSHIPTLVPVFKEMVSALSISNCFNTEC